MGKHRQLLIACSALCLFVGTAGAQGNVFGNSAPAKPPIESTWLQVVSPPLTPNARSIAPRERDLHPCEKKIATPDSLAVASYAYLSVMVWVDVDQVGYWKLLPKAPTRADTLRARVINIDCGLFSPVGLVLQSGSKFFRLDVGALDKPREFVPSMSSVFVMGNTSLEPAALVDATCEGCVSRIVSSVPFVDSVRKAAESARLEAAAQRSAREDEQRRAAAAMEAAARPAALLRERAAAEIEKLQRAEDDKAERKRASTIRAKGWPASITKAVIARQIKFGMSREQVRMSWGEPDDINRTVIPGHVSEQWIYGSQYVYFTNGAVTAWQD
jgi:hypothetical protein